MPMSAHEDSYMIYSGSSRGSRGGSRVAAAESVPAADEEANVGGKDAEVGIAVLSSLPSKDAQVGEATTDAAARLRHELGERKVKTGEIRTIRSTTLAQSLRLRQDRTLGLISIPIAMITIILYSQLLASHFTMSKIADVNSGLEYLINGGDLAFPDIVRVDEVWDWSNDHVLGLLWPEPCLYGCNDPTAANYGAVVDIDDAGSPGIPCARVRPINILLRCVLRAMLCSLNPFCWSVGGKLSSVRVLR